MTLKLRIGAIAIAGGMLAAAAPAAAQLNTLLRPGYYTIRVDAVYPNLPAANQCLIQGNNGLGGPVRYLWSEQRASSYLCGWGDFDAFLGNGQALFNLKDAGYSSEVGARVYVLQNKRSGQCLRYDRPSGQVTFTSQGCDPLSRDLSTHWIIHGANYASTFTYSPIRPWTRRDACLIFGNNGYDYSPQVYRWSNVPSDQRWCGLGSEYALEKTGQANFEVAKIANL